MDIKIIYEDSDLLVVDKPTGITVNRSDTTREEETVQDWTEKQFTIDNLPLIIDREGDFYKRGGIVHRLDKETSGILLIAKNPASFLNLQNQFKERRVEKTYIALVHGEIKPEIGEINVPVGRLPFNRKRFGIVAGGREAVTKYKLLSVFSSQLSANSQPVLDSSVQKNRQQINQNLKTKNREPITESYSLLELYPKTGRTHQIRVHLKYSGHPVFSDPLYGGRKTSRNDRKVLPRLFLHAAKISFQHPKTGKEVSFESLLPQELVNFLSVLSPIT